MTTPESLGSRPRVASGGWLVPGATLDRYELLIPVAEGGMAHLWLARQRGKFGFDRVVAIKTILPKYASEGGFQQMFLDEARMASSVSHANVARVLDLGEENGVLFIAMDWIDGESLVNVGRKGFDIPLGILARITADACAGLHAAHAAVGPDGQPLDLVHRDVSPHNLLVGFDGVTRIIDFGIAKACNRLARETSIGVVKGKIAYMSPEQAMAQTLDRRTDIWSVGATLFRYLAGRPPYGSGDPASTMRAILERRPAPLTPDSVPLPLRRVVDKALEFDPAKRYQTAQAMEAALHEAMRDADLLTTHEDVAEFMQARLAEDRATRSRELDLSVRASRERQRRESGVDPDEVPRPAESHPISGSTPLPVARSIRELASTLRSAPDSIPCEDAGSYPSGVSPAPAPSIPVPLWRAKRRLSLRWPVSLAGVAVLCAAALVWRAGATPSASLAVPTSAPPSPQAGSMSGVSAPEIVVKSGGITVASSVTPPTEHPATVSPALAPADAPAPTFGGLMDRGRKALRAGKMADARAAFAQAVALAPTNCEALTRLAETEQALGQGAEALADYDRAVRVNDRYLPARLGLADARWAAGQTAAATAAYKGILDSFPSAICPARVFERTATAPPEPASSTGAPIP